MGAGVVTVGRRPYAVGLYWENAPGGRLAQTAREAAAQPGQQADFYAIRPGNKDGRNPQFGLGQASAGHKAGMPVFAACLANQQPGSWGGAFRLQQGTIVIIVRDDLIVPDGDQFFVNESEARDRLLQEIGFGGLQRVYAPESWAISGSDTMPVSLLLDERRDIRLRPVTVPKKMILIGVAAVVVLLLALGGGWYYTEKQAEEEAARQAQEDVLRRMREQANKANPFDQQPKYPPPERRWESAPTVASVINACRTALAQVPSSQAGWKLGQVQCNGRGLSLAWSRETGFSAPPPGAVLNDSAGTGESSVALPPLPPRGHENLMDTKDVTERYLGQNWPGTIARVADDPPPPPPAGYNGAWTPPPPPWVKRSFTVTVPELPGGILTYVGDLPGAVIESVTYTGTSWRVEGVIYENRP